MKRNLSCILQKCAKVKMTSVVMQVDTFVQVFMGSLFFFYTLTNQSSTAHAEGKPTHPFPLLLQQTNPRKVPAAAAATTTDVTQIKTSQKVLVGGFGPPLSPAASPAASPGPREHHTKREMHLTGKVESRTCWVLSINF